MITLHIHTAQNVQHIVLCVNDPAALVPK